MACGSRQYGIVSVAAFVIVFAGVMVKESGAYDQNQVGSHRIEAARMSDDGSIVNDLCVLATLC